MLSPAMHSRLASNFSRLKATTYSTYSVWCAQFHSAYSGNKHRFILHIRQECWNKSEYSEWNLFLQFWKDTAPNLGCVRTLNPTNQEQNLL
jgi:hypothetical protein